MSQIEFINITKQYGNFKALDNISFTINNGEFIFLVGPSGAGKSTIIKLLIREELSDAGEILFNGKNIREFTQKEMPDLRRKIGVVFQDFKLLNSKNVFENVSIALEVVNSSETEIKSIVPNVLNLVGLTDKILSFPKQLSGGERQRLCIARALAHEPDVLIADEATGNIDPDASQEILDLLGKINSLGTTVIMATHDERMVDQMKKRVLRLDKGSIISDKKGGKYRE
ncbi:MAG TPA: cell division ATP-binding protein FtsE [bacterium]|jgi:cell division transport system ATP-binding protein|nr:cell division ATP-binding protein FtsE [bacterium]